MQPFKVNRNSWHYKLNMKFMNNYGDNEYYMRDRWEPKHNNFCSYWRVTFFRMVWVAILAAGGLAIASLVGVGIYNDPIGSAIFLGIIISAITFAIGVVYVRDKLENRKDSDAPKSLFMQKYIAYKSKVCPQVSYD